MKTKHHKPFFILSLLGGILLLSSCQDQGSSSPTLIDRLVRDGNLASHEDIQAALTEAAGGNIAPMETWAKKFPQIAYSKEDQSVVLVQEKQDDAQKMQSKISIFQDGETFTTDIDRRYRISEITFDEEHFTLKYTARFSKDAEPEIRDLSFPASAGKDLIEKGLLSSIFDGSAAKKSS